MFRHFPQLIFDLKASYTKHDIYLNLQYTERQKTVVQEVSFFRALCLVSRLQFNFLLLFFSSSSSFFIPCQGAPLWQNSARSLSISCKSSVQYCFLMQGLQKNRQSKLLFPSIAKCFTVLVSLLQQKTCQEETLKRPDL